jgi:predicted enzyme related to lactoylglutathione lyase
MGNPFAHIELNTDDVAKAKKFYTQLFDWKLEDMTGDGMPYTMINAGKDPGGGMMKKMDSAPTTWLPYVHVASVKTTLDKASKAGAQVVLPYHEIGDMGAIGVFVDPSGAALGVWEMGKAAQAAAKKPAAKKAAKKVEKKAAKKAEKKAEKKAGKKAGKNAGKKK